MGITDGAGNRLLSVDDAVDYVGVSKRTIYRLVKKGVLEKKKLEGTRGAFVTMDSLDAYIQAQGLSLEEMASRIIMLERRVNFLMNQGGQTMAVRTGFGEGRDFTTIQAHLRKHHPDYS